MNGYLNGDTKAAAYCGIDRKTICRWQADSTLKHRELIMPRVVRGRKIYRIAKLDAFLNPELNTERPRFQGYAA